jgi:hypothetical protein
MKSTMKKLIPALLVLLITASCNKYEDGPKLSLRSRKARIVNTWKVEKYMVGDVDYTASFKTTYPDYTVVFDKSGTYSISVTYSNVVVSETGTWELSDSKSFIIRNETSPTVTTHSNEITRLKNDELNTKYFDSNGALVEMQFVPK